jgi:SAM-dependent methyltransferase
VNADWWKYENLESGLPYDWSHASRGDSPYDNVDFHLDIGMGVLKKARLGIDRHLAPGVDLCIDLETLTPAAVTVNGGLHLPTRRQYDGMGLRSRSGVNGEATFRSALPFPDNSIESIISHHCMEHIADGFVRLMDECHRVLKPGGLLRVVVPLFPSRTAVEDPDHKRYFMLDTFQTFCGAADGSHWHEAFSVPYTKCRFEMVDRDYTAPLPVEEQWGEKDARELRVALRKHLQEV